MKLALMCVGPAEFEDLNGGCPKVDEAHPRPSYMVPINPSHDPWSWYRRVLTFQARAPWLAGAHRGRVWMPRRPATPRAQPVRRAACGSCEPG